MNNSESRKPLRGRKGNVSIVLLVIGIFAVCSLAIVTFFISNSKVNNSLEGIMDIKEMNSAINQYTFYINQGVSEEKAKSFFDVRLNDFGEEVLFFEKKDTRWSLDFSNNFEEEYVVFSVEYVLP